jgi:ankyrin repeat protein
VLDAGLQIKLDVSSGINYAKFPSKVDLENGNETRLDNARVIHFRLISDDQAKPDASFVALRLMNATTWGDTEELEYIIRTCYVPASAGASALIEACSRGLEECAEVLLRAGASPSCSSRGMASLKSAFHYACENGNEACAKILISHMTSIDECYVLNASGATGFDVLRSIDLCGMARRLEAFAAERLG